MAVVKERGIICPNWEVRAFLAGRKTQLRRPVGDRIYTDNCGTIWTQKLGKPGYESGPCAWHCPFGKPGDSIYVKETWAGADEMYGDHSDPPRVIAYHADRSAVAFNWLDNKPSCVSKSDLMSWNWDVLKKRSSSQMPEWASRIRRAIASVSVQRLQDLSEADALAEGLVVINSGTEVRYASSPNNRGEWLDPREAFRCWWDYSNSKRAPWSSNPWVWALTFKGVEASCPA